jgi:hypothetical protein
MAEKVEVIRVPREVVKTIERMSPEKHTAGIYKAAEIDSWLVGVKERPHKTARVGKAANFTEAVMREFAQWCSANKLMINWNVGGEYAKAIAMIFKLGEKAADLYVATAIPSAYQGFWSIAKQKFKNLYYEVRQ